MKLQSISAALAKGLATALVVLVVTAGIPFVGLAFGNETARGSGVAGTAPADSDAQSAPDSSAIRTLDPVLAAETSNAGALSASSAVSEDALIPVEQENSDQANDTTSSEGADGAEVDISGFTILSADLTDQISLQTGFFYFDMALQEFVRVPPSFLFMNDQVASRYRIKADWDLAGGVIVEEGSSFRIPISFEGSDMRFGNVLPISFKGIDQTSGQEFQLGTITLKHTDALGNLLDTPLTEPGSYFALIATFDSGAFSALNNIKGEFFIDCEIYPEEGTEYDEFKWTVGNETGEGSTQEPYVPPIVGEPGWSTKEDFKKLSQLDANNAMVLNSLYINEQRESFSTYGSSVKLADTIGPGQVLSQHYVWVDGSGFDQSYAPQTVDYARGIFGSTVTAPEGAPAYFKMLAIDWEHAYQILYDVQRGRNKSSLAGYPITNPASIPNLSYELQQKYLIVVRSATWAIITRAVGGDSISQAQGALIFGTDFSYLNSNPAYATYRATHGDFTDFEDVLAYFLTPVDPAALNSIEVDETSFTLDFKDKALDKQTLFISYLTKVFDPLQSLLSNSANIDWKGSPRPVYSSTTNTTGGGVVTGDTNTIMLHKLDPQGNPLPGAHFNVSRYAADDIELTTPLFSEDLILGNDGAWASTDRLGTYTKEDQIVITETHPPRGFLPIPEAKIVLHIDPEHNYAVVSCTPVPSGGGADGVPWLHVSVTNNGSVHIYVIDQLDQQLSLYDVALRKWIVRVNDTAVADDAAAQGLPSPVVQVDYNDYVTFKIRVFNQCEESLIAAEITDYFPRWLLWDEDLASVENAGWSLVPGTGGARDLLVYDWSDYPTGAPVLTPNTSTEPGVYSEGSYADVYLTLRVSPSAPAGDVFTNLAEVSRLTDEDGAAVVDIDSIPDQDPENDGAVWDNVIDGNAKDPSASGADKDEDDSDLAEVIIPKAISCEVDKDTINRTSAAYVSLPGQEGFDNVGKEDERFRYDIDFRSTANTDCTEFVVDDPLENVGTLDQVRVEELWTAVVWGDKDGRFNVWYKTNKTDDSADYDISTLSVDSGVLAFPNTGFKLWAAFDDATSSSYTESGVIPRHRLSLPEGLADDEYITAIRFEYGEVSIGFTSKNYSDVSKNGEHRDSEGNVALPSEKASALKLLSTSDPFSPSLATGEAITKTSLDWTPQTIRSDFAQGALDAPGLKPASYLVSATRLMEDDDIVSSASARIALAEMRDLDQDAVVTKEIGTFKTLPIIPNFEIGLDKTSSEVNDDLKVNQRTVWGGLPLTGDDIVLLVVGLVLCLVGLCFIVASRRRLRLESDSSGLLAAASAGVHRRPTSTEPTVSMEARLGQREKSPSRAGMHSRRRRLRFKWLPITSGFLLMLGVLVSHAFAEPVSTVPADSLVNVEYRYLEGESVDIPQEIVQYGQRYRLVSQTEPTLENMLPTTRTYTYRVYGKLTEEGLAEAKALPGVSIIPVDLVFERQVEGRGIIEGLSDNDVDNPDLPTKGLFSVTSADAATGTVQSELSRAGVAYEVTSYDEFGLPETYKATLVFRGIESFKDFGYYEVNAQYTSTEQIGEKAQYVIVATYEPVDLVITTPEGAWQAGIDPSAGSATGEQSTDAAADGQDEGSGQLGLTPPVTVPNKPPVADGMAGNVLAGIPDGEVALAGQPGSPALALIAVFIGLVLIALLTVFLWRRKRAGK